MDPQQRAAIIKPPSLTAPTEDMDPLRWSHPARWLVVASFALWLLFSRAVNIGGDTFWYVEDIRGTLGRPWTDSAPIWNFAHLLWRPMGKVLAMFFLPLIGSYFDNGEPAAITFLLMAVNVLAALVCAWILQSAIGKLTGRPWIAALVAVSFLFFNPILNYSRSGSPYVFALTASTLALYLATFPIHRQGRDAVLAGILAGVAACSWIPFLLSFPAVLLARPILRSERFSFRFAAVLATAGGATLTFFYGIALWALHITNWAALSAWIHASSSDVRQQTLLRMVAGVVRSLYNLGQDAVWLKWYVFKDPYAQVSLLDLLQASLTTILLFYVTIVVLALTLWSSKKGKRLLLLLGILAAPHLALALAYESGDPARYIAFLGLGTIAFGYAMAGNEIGQGRRSLAVLLCCLPIPMNLWASQATPSVEQQAERIHTLTSLQQGSKIFVVDRNDELFALRFSAPFHPVNKQPLPAMEMIVPWSDSISQWRREFACKVLSGWAVHGEVWISTRVRQPRPLRDWLWVEGDHPHLPWQSIYEFFRKFQTGMVKGEEDGFFQLAGTEQNRAVLTQEVASAAGCEMSPDLPAR